MIDVMLSGDEQEKSFISPESVNNIQNCLFTRIRYMICNYTVSMYKEEPFSFGLTAIYGYSK